MQQIVACVDKTHTVGEQVVLEAVRPEDLHDLCQLILIVSATEEGLSAENLLKQSGRILDHEKTLTSRTSAARMQPTLHRSRL